MAEDDTNFDNVDNFDMHLLTFEMGEAYRIITEQMGPNPQLLAFINYDKVISTDPSVGALESLNIIDQHEQTLADIKADPSFSMACESFSGRLKSISERFKNAVTFNKHDNLNDLISEHLEARKSSIYVVPASHLERVVGYVKNAEAALDYLLPLVPKGTNNLEAWEEFYKEHVAGESKLNSFIRSIDRDFHLFRELGKPGEFDKSGWTDIKLKDGLKKLGTLQVGFSDRKARVADICGDLEETLDLVNTSVALQKSDEYQRRRDVADSIENGHKKDEDPTKKHWLGDVLEKTLNETERQQRKTQHDRLMKMVPSHVIAAMNRVSVCVDRSSSLIAWANRWMYKSLVDVSRHYEIVRR